MKRVLLNMAAGSALTLIVLAFIGAGANGDKRPNPPQTSSIPSPATEQALAPPRAAVKPAEPITEAPVGKTDRVEEAENRSQEWKPTQALLSAPASQIRKIAASELAVQTHKWDGDIIETTMRCFYADVNEFRCVAGARARVDFIRLDPPEEQHRVQKACDTQAALLSDRCNFTIRFVYDGFETMDIGGIMGKSTLILARDHSGMIMPSSSRRGKKH